MEENRRESLEQENRTWKNNLEKYLDIAITSFLVIAACILFYYFLFKFEKVKAVAGAFASIISPIVVGFVFAYIMNPMVVFIEDKLCKIKDNHAKKVEQLNRKSSDSERKPKGKIGKRLATAGRWIAACFVKNGKSDDIPDCTNQNTTIENKKGIRRISIAVTEITVVGVVILLIISVVPAFARSLASFVEKIPGYYDQISNEVMKFIRKHEWIEENIPNLDDVIKNFDIAGMVSGYVDSILSTAYNWVVVVFKLVYNVVIGVIVSVYLLGGKERYIGQMKKISFAIMKPERAKNFVQIMNGTNRIFKSAILGKILDSIIIGCMCFIGMAVFGMFGFEAMENNKILISVIVGVTNVIPFFGPYIGGIPSVVLLLFERPIDGVVFTVFIVALQQFDCNYLDPKIVGKSVGLSPFYVLAACLVCGGMFGIVGMLIASPTCAVIYGLVKSWAETRLDDKNLPIDTAQYSEKPGAVILKESKE